MSFSTCARRMVFVACIGQALAGCGPLQENTPDRLDFALPSLLFEVSSQGLQWRPAPSTGVPNMVCAGPQAIGTDCCAPPSPLPLIDCQQYPVACDPVDNFCALTFDVEENLVVDLVTDVPEVAAVEGRVFADVSILALDITVTGLANLPIRGAELYVGPKDLGGASSPAANLLAPVSLVSGTNLVVPGADAQQAFSSLARDYRTPFSILLAAHVVVPSGTSPAGTVTVRVNARAQALY
jgi:hypothetical protein